MINKIDKKMFKTLEKDSSFYVFYGDVVLGEFSDLNYAIEFIVDGINSKWMFDLINIRTKAYLTNL